VVASEDGVASGEWRVANEIGVTVNPKSAIQNRKGSAGHRKMCQTKPIRNQRKALCRLRLNRRRPSRRAENEANSHRQWRVAGGQWSVKTQWRVNSGEWLENSGH